MKELNFWSISLLAMFFVGLILTISESENFCTFAFTKLLAAAIFVLIFRLANVWKDQGKL